jgi:hypothetical protein
VTDTPPDPPGHPDDTGDSGGAQDTDDTGPGVPGRRVHGSEEEIDEAGDESFPASDAPQWWSGESDDDN